MSKVKDFFVNFYNTKRKIAIGIIIFLAVLLVGGVVLYFVLRPPAPPEDLRATVRSYEAINLTWIDPQRADGYRIFRSQETGTDYEEIAVTANRHYLDDELEPETTYYYRITKIVGSKESNYTPDVHATTEGVGTVSNLRAQEVGHDYIHLVWDGYRESEGYVIYRTEDPDRPYMEIDTTTNEYYFDSDLENNKAYYYVVTQVVNGEESEYSRRLLTATRDWSCGTAINYDDKFYGTIQIGNQCWFKENLNYETEEGSWCYDNEDRNCNSHGRLYSWETAMNRALEERAQGICPEGWHIPSDDDFKELERHLGMSRVQANASDWRGQEINIGDIMKVPSSCSQVGEDFCGNSGFNIVMGGSRSSAGAFRYMGTHSFFWTSTLAGENVFRRLLGIDNSGVHRDTASKQNGFFVRCIKS
jgi:uncharacterized protein (TIGR02145 family)